MFPSQHPLFQEEAAFCAGYGGQRSLSSHREETARERAQAKHLVRNQSPLPVNERPTVMTEGQGNDVNNYASQRSLSSALPSPH